MLYASSGAPLTPRVSLSSLHYDSAERTRSVSPAFSCRRGRLDASWCDAYNAQSLRAFLLHTLLILSKVSPNLMSRVTFHRFDFKPCESSLPAPTCDLTEPCSSSRRCSFRPVNLARATRDRPHLSAGRISKTAHYLGKSKIGRWFSEASLVGHLNSRVPQRARSVGKLESGSYRIADVGGVWPGLLGQCL